MAILALIRSLLFPFAIYTTTQAHTSNITSMIEIFGHVSKYLRQDFSFCQLLIIWEVFIIWMKG